jgi:hypothetical protein
LEKESAFRSASLLLLFSSFVLVIQRIRLFKAASKYDGQYFRENVPNQPKNQKKHQNYRKWQRLVISKPLKEHLNHPASTVQILTD